MEKKEFKVFYCYQSEREASAEFLERILKSVILKINKNPKYDFTLKFDRDTLGKVGPVEITPVILDKIRECAIIVADLTIVGTGRNRKKRVNQNVIFEFGYAYASKEIYQLLPIMNIDYGRPTELPFDIKNKKIETFSMKKNKNNLKNQLEVLLSGSIAEYQKYLKNSENSLQNTDLVIRTMDGVAAQKDELTNQKTALINAIETKKSVGVWSGQYFELLYTYYSRLYFSRIKEEDFSSTEFSEKVYGVYLESRLFTLDLFEVFNFAGEAKQYVVLEAAFENLNILTKHFFPKGTQLGEATGKLREYFLLICQDIMALVFGMFDRYELWGRLRQLTRTKLDKFIPDRLTSRAHFDMLLELYPTRMEKFINQRDGEHHYSAVQVLFNEMYAEYSQLSEVYTNGEIFLFSIFKNDYRDYYPRSLWNYLQGVYKGVPHYVWLLKESDFWENLFLIFGNVPEGEVKRTVWGNMNEDLAVPVSFKNRNLKYFLLYAGIDDIEKFGGSYRVAYV
jgi:hypothetical protein